MSLSKLSPCSGRSATPTDTVTDPTDSISCPDQCVPSTARRPPPGARLRRLGRHHRRRHLGRHHLQHPLVVLAERALPTRPAGERSDDPCPDNEWHDQARLHVLRPPAVEGPLHGAITPA